MRVSILTFGAVPALAASTQSAPLAPQPAGIDVNAALPIKLVNHGCGWRRRPAGTVRVVEQPGLALRDPTPCRPNEQVLTAFICTSWSRTRAIGAYYRGRRSGFSTNED
jgi:hypothetical protein